MSQIKFLCVSKIVTACQPIYEYMSSIDEDEDGTETGADKNTDKAETVNVAPAIPASIAPAQSSPPPIDTLISTIETVQEWRQQTLYANGESKGTSTGGLPDDTDEADTVSITSSTQRT